MAPLRLMMVTFDLTGTVPGDSRYAQADDALKFNSKAFFRPIKQVRFIITDKPAERIKAAVTQRIGSRSSIVILEVTNLLEWRILMSRQQQEWRKLNDAVRRYGITVKGLDTDTDSAL